MLLLANIVLCIVVIAARQDEPFKYEEDISPQIDRHQSKHLVPMKSDEILSNLIKTTLPRSYKHEFKDKSKMAKKLKHIDSIMDEILAQSFNDKYNKYMSDPKGQGIRMKRARRQYQSTNVGPAGVEPGEEESHGFVKQLIPSLLPIPNYDYLKDHSGNDTSGTIQFISNGTRFQNEVIDIYNVSGKSKEKNNSTDNSANGNTDGKNSTNTKDDGKGDDKNDKDKTDQKDSEKNRNEDNGKEDNKNDVNGKDKTDQKDSEKDRNQDNGKEDVNDKDNTDQKDSDKNRNQDNSKEDNKNDQNDKHDKNLKDGINAEDDTMDDSKHKVTTLPASTTVDPGLLEEPITLSTVLNDPDDTPYTPHSSETNDTHKLKDSELNNTNSPSVNGDTNVLCTDKDHVLGINCSAYIIRLYRDDPVTNQNVAMYLKITTPLKSDMVCSMANSSDILKSPTGKPVYSNVGDIAGHVPQDIKLVVPFYQTSPKYEEEFHSQSYMYSSAPSIKIVSNSPNTRSTVERIVSTYQTTPKFINEQQSQLQYPNIPEATNMLQNPPQLFVPMRHVTPRSPTIQNEVKPNTPEFSDHLRYKLKQLTPLLNNLLASKIREKLQNSAKQNIPKSTHSVKMPELKNHKEERRISADNIVSQASDVQNMISVNRPESHHFRSKDEHMLKPKPDHFPGVISGLRKKDGRTFFDYFPFYNSASSKRMKRFAATSLTCLFFSKCY